MVAIQLYSHIASYYSQLQLGSQVVSYFRYAHTPKLASPHSQLIYNYSYTYDHEQLQLQWRLNLVAITTCTHVIVSCMSKLFSCEVSHHHDTQKWIMLVTRGDSPCTTASSMVADQEKYTTPMFISEPLASQEMKFPPKILRQLCDTLLNFTLQIYQLASQFYIAIASYTWLHTQPAGDTSQIYNPMQVTWGLQLNLWTH